MPFLTLHVPGQSVDIAPLIEEIKWSENDLDSPNSGRALDGTMWRGKTASKRKAEIKLLPQRTETVNEIFTVIRNEYFWCDTDLVPAENAVIMEMYNSTRSGGVMIVTTEGEIKHKDISFNIIER